MPVFKVKSPKFRVVTKSKKSVKSKKAVKAKKIPNLANIKKYIKKNKVNANTLLKYKEEAEYIMANPGYFKKVYDSYFNIEGIENINKMPFKNVYATFRDQPMTEEQAKIQAKAYFPNIKQQYDTLSDDIMVTNAQSWIHSFDERSAEDNTSHAKFFVKTNNGKFFLFNHYKFYIFFMKDQLEQTQSIIKEKIIYQMYCNVDIVENQISLKKLWQYAICHWWLTNATTGRDPWPGSCTGFTDFLMFCVGGDDIYTEKCKLTKNKENSRVGEPISNPMFKSKKSKSKKSKSKKSKSKKSNLKF